MPAGRLIEDHRSKNRLGREMAIDLGLTLELPDIAAIALLGNVNIEAIPRNYRPAEASIVDAHEVDQLTFRSRPQGVYDQHRGGLRHRLNDQNSGHHWPSRKMALKVVLVDRDVLDAGCADV